MTAREKVICTYCDRPTKLVGSTVIYPHRHDLLGKSFWHCKPCGAHVGCHPGTIKPLGRPANAELRRARQRLHRAFDPIWKCGQMKRTEAYAKLAAALNIAPQNCHVGMLDLAACEAAQSVLKEWKA